VFWITLETVVVLAFECVSLFCLHFVALSLCLLWLPTECTECLRLFCSLSVIRLYLSLVLALCRTGECLPLSHLTEWWLRSELSIQCTECIRRLCSLFCYLTVLLSCTCAFVAMRVCLVWLPTECTECIRLLCSLSVIRMYLSLVLTLCRTGECLPLSHLTEWWLRCKLSIQCTECIRRLCSLSVIRMRLLCPRDRFCRTESMPSLASD
jgi:hypothetical protein